MSCSISLEYLVEEFKNGISHFLVLAGKYVKCMKVARIVAFFGWTAALDAILTTENLRKKER